MEDILESQLEPLLLALLSKLMEHFAFVLLAILLISCVVALFILNRKRRSKLQVINRASQLLTETSSRLNELLVSDRFRDLELGLVEGESKRRLLRMQQIAFNLRQESEQLGTKLKNVRPRFFSLLDDLYQAMEIEHEVEDVNNRVDRYIKDLSDMKVSVDRTRQSVGKLTEAISAASQEIMGLSEQTGYPLDELMEQLIQVEAECQTIDQLAAFDTVQAELGLPKLQQQIDSLQRKTKEIRKNITILDEISARVKKQEAQMLERMNQDKLDLADTVVNPIIILRQTDDIIQQLEASLRLGQEVDLRARALEIEHILKEALALLDNNSNSRYD